MQQPFPNQLGDNHEKEGVDANPSSKTVTLEETPTTVRFFLKRLAVDLHIPKFFGDPKFNVSVVGMGLGSFVLIRDKIKHSWFRAVLCYKPEKTPILIDLHGASEQTVEAIKKAIREEESIIFYFSMDGSFSKENFEEKATSLVSVAKEYYLKQLPKQKNISVSFDISIIAGEMSFSEFLEKSNTEKAKNEKQTFQIISTPNELNALPDSNTKSNTVTTGDLSQTAITVTGSEPTKSPSLLNWGMLIGGVAILVTGLILLVFLQPYVGLFCIACGSGLAGWGGVKLLEKNTLADNNDPDVSSWKLSERDSTTQTKSNPEQFQSPTPSNKNDSNLQSKEAPSVTVISISKHTGTNETSNLENLEDIKSFQEWGEVVRQDLYQKTLNGEETVIKEILKDSSKSLVNTYKSLAKKYHPDRVTEAQQKVLNTEAFKKLKQVYDQIEKGWELALQGIDAANYFVAEQGEDKKQNELLKEQNKLLEDHISFLKEHKKILEDMHKEINEIQDSFSSDAFKKQLNAEITQCIEKQIKAEIQPTNDTVDISGDNPTIHTKGF